MNAARTRAKEEGKVDFSFITNEEGEIEKEVNKMSLIEHTRAIVEELHGKE